MKKSVYQTGKIVSSFLLPSALSLLFFFSFSIFSSCITYKLEKALDPESKEFLSKARYIISKQERKIFLNLPPSEREAFIEEFWKKRDPDPRRMSLKNSILPELKWPTDSLKEAVLLVGSRTEEEFIFFSALQIEEINIREVTLFTESQWKYGIMVFFPLFL